MTSPLLVTLDYARALRVFGEATLTALWSPSAEAEQALREAEASVKALEVSESDTVAK